MYLEALNTVRSSRSGWLRDDQHSFLLAGMMWALIILMIVPEGFDYRSLADPAAPTSGGAISRGLWLGLLGLSVIIIFWRGGLAWLLARTVNPFLFLFAALAIASITWSIDPTLTSRRLIRMVTMILVCAAFVLMSWHSRRYQNVIRPIITIMLLGSIIFGLVFPALAIHQETSPELLGAWRGLANHKNGLGALACFGLILWFHAWLSGEVKTLRALAGGGLATTCLLLSRSSTSLSVALFIMLVLWVLLRSQQGFRPYIPYLIALLMTLVLIYALAVLNLIPGMGTLMAPITALTGKDMTFTGRTEIWAIMSEHIRYHPFLGTGYGAYWTAAPTPGTDAYEFILRMGGFYPGSAHNGYLEILNDLGWAGLLCLLAYIVMHLWQSHQLLGIDRTQGALYLGLFFQQALTNLSETHWFSVLSVDFVIMTLATMALARGILEYRLHLALGAPPPPQPVPRAPAHGMPGPALARKSIAPTPGDGIP